MIAILIFLTLLTVSYIALPFFSNGFTFLTAPESQRRNLTLRKEKLLAAFRDLELDYQTQKMSNSDFSSQKAALLVELDEVYKALDAGERRP